MRKLLSLALLAVIVSAVLPETSAAATLINFDSMAASNNGAGIPNNPASVLDTDLNSLGIVFGHAGVSTGVAVVNSAGAAFSNSNGIAGLNASGASMLLLAIGLAGIVARRARRGRT